MKPKLTLRDLFWLVLVVTTFVRVHADEKPARSNVSPRIASSYLIRGSRETIKFLEWTKTRHSDFAAAYLNDAGDITMLDMNMCLSITDSDTEQIRRLVAVKAVSADGEQLTDKGFIALAEMKSLESLWIVGAKKVSDTAINRVRKARPKLQLNMLLRD